MIRPAFFDRSVLGRTLWGFRRELAWVVVFSMFANLLLLTPTLYMLQVFDRVLTSGSELSLLALSLIAVLFFLVMGFADWIRSRLLVRASTRLDEAMNTQVFWASFAENLKGAGRNSMQAFTDMTMIRQFLTGNGIYAIVDLPWTLIYLGVLFLMHPWLGWCAIAFAVVQIALAFVSHRLTAPRHVLAQADQNETQAFVHGKLRNAETIQAMGMLPNLRRLWLDKHDKQLLSHATAAEWAARMQSASKFMQYTQQSLMLSIGALLAIDGKISPGAMIASNALMGNALRPVNVVVATWKQFIDARLAYRRLETLLESNPPQDGKVTDGQIRGQITLKGLVATVPGRQQPILNGIDAEFKAGEIVAIVGPSGAGKSTLVRCLVGIWPEVRGEVILDGHPLKDWSRDLLGERVGYLPQDIELLDGTIAENIGRFGKIDSSRIIEAAERTGIHQMILRFPKGYDTPMGEAGALLSGGQRQRVGLARAILGEPSLVVLDEPNSNLDDAGEQALIVAMRELRARGSTVFMVVHQRNLLSIADRVVQMAGGKIVQQLTPAGPLATTHSEQASA